MKYKNFEKHISESFLHDSAAVDTDALIASLGIPVAQEPKRIIAWWMLTGLALLSLLVVGLYYFVNVPLSSQSSDASSMVSTADEMNAKSKESIATVAEDDETITENVNEQDSKTEEVKSSQLSVDVNTSESSMNENIQLNISKNNNTEGKTGSAENKNNSKIASSENAVKNITPSKFATNEILELQTSNSTSETTATTNRDNENKSSSDLVRKFLEVLSPIELLESGVVSTEDSPGIAEPECPSFSYRIPWNIALLAEVGVMKPMKDLQNVGGTNSVFELRESNENSKEAIQVGLHVKVSKGSNPLYVRGGAAYTRISEQMNEEYDYIELDTMRGLISITTSMTGDTVTAIYGDVVSETRYTGRSVKHYFLHLIDLPVAVGYEMPIAGSFYAGAEVGVQLNLRTSGSGLIFRDINDYADLSEVTTKETKVGLSYFGGFHIGKHLSKRSSVQLSARFRYYPSRFSTVDPSIEQRYNLAGLHAGYVFRF